MDPDDQILIQHLFAKATIALENAHDRATRGQDGALDGQTAQRLAEALHRAADDVSKISSVIAVIAAQPDEVASADRDL